MDRGFQLLYFGIPVLDATVDYSDNITSGFNISVCWCHSSDNSRHGLFHVYGSNCVTFCTYVVVRGSYAYNSLNCVMYLLQTDIV